MTMASHARLHSRRTNPTSPALEKLTPTLPDHATLVEIVPRATSSSAESGGINPSIPIAIGVCIPVLVIIVSFIWLHRRHVQKQRQEDRADPHKSLDFGLGSKSNTSRGQRKEMGQIDFESSIRRGRGLSMDIGSPYLLPPEVHSSSESLHSLTPRNIIQDSHDPYRPVTALLASAPGSVRNSAFTDDNASIRTGSSMHASSLRGYRPDGMSSPLVSNAQRMPFSSSPTALQSIGEQQMSDSRSQSRSPLSSPPIQEDSHSTISEFVQHPPAAYLAQEHPKSMASKPVSPPPAQQTQAYSQPQNPSFTLPQITVDQDDEDHQHHQPHGYYEDSDYVQQSESQHPSVASPSVASEAFYTPTEESHNPHAVSTPTEGLGVSNVPFDGRRISVLRPLPPDDPADSPAQRALRIRSFYREYFNEGDARVYQQAPNEYYEDYSSEYLGDGAIYDPTSGQFIVGGAPYAEPITRRAMTPPPRGPPRFAPQGRHGSTGSAPMPGRARARAFSTVSAGFHGQGKKRNAPPPAPLRNLPTPHLLKEDAFSLPIDFAPPVRIKDQAAGRSPSPLMGSRPFSPQVAIASPLASSFMDMPAMPSPHHLRRSGTFTALDFAPPPRFKDKDNMSDAGSIRSGRSTHSTSSRMQVQNIRAGAYRVSRIPKELVGTQGEFADILKPTWKVGS